MWKKFECGTYPRVLLLWMVVAAARLRFIGVSHTFNPSGTV